MSHTIRGFSIVNEAKVDIFLEFSSFLYDPMDVGNLISGSSPFSKSSLYIWKFLVHVLLKPGLKDFEHYFATCEMSALCSSLKILWHCLCLGLEWKLAFSPVLCLYKIVFIVQLLSIHNVADPGQFAIVTKDGVLFCQFLSLRSEPSPWRNVSCYIVSLPTERFPPGFSSNKVQWGAGSCPQPHKWAWTLRWLYPWLETVCSAEKP